MKALDLQSEPYQATGSISAEGIKNQLGRPKLDRLSLLAREAVQNSWDARLPGGKVLFGISGWDLDDDQLLFLSDTVFRKTPPGGLDLLSRLDQVEQPRVLAIYDRGTRGLEGPTRADAMDVGAQANFVDLLRNVGQPPLAFRGGGTYGFGKTALFLASAARTILVHSRVSTPRGHQHRFMGAALGSQYASLSRRRSTPKRFTGRHWWGRKGRGGIVDPLTGRDASSAARALGLPGFGAEDTGTTILVLLPDFDGRAPEEALRHIGRAILQTFWPKMVDGARLAGSMDFELSWNDATISVPRPQDTPPFDGYVKAFANLQAHLAGKKPPHQPAELYPIRSLKPVKDLGLLSLIRFPPSPHLAITGLEDDDDGPFGGTSRHTALMRGPHFVVNYVEGPAIPYDDAEYAGVFLASQEAEEAFARSEPPAHDDWTPDMLDDRSEKTYVRVGIRRIREAMQEFSGAPLTSRSAGGAVALGGFSDLLGGLVPAETGTGARSNGDVPPGTQTKGGGGRDTSGGDRRPAVRLRILETGAPERIGDTLGFVVRFDLESGEARETTTRVTAVPSVLLEDGTVEGEAPAGSEKPQILSWSDRSGDVLGADSTFDISAGDVGPWQLAVALPPDAAVVVDLNIVEVG